MKTETNKVLIQAATDYEQTIVSINEEALYKLNISDQQRNILDNNKIDCLKNRTIKQSVLFLIGQNSINYQFWDIENGKFTRYQNKGKIGALALFEGFACLYAYLEKDMFNARLINKECIQEYFGDISDKEQRISILKESLNFTNFEQVFNIIEKHIKKEKINVILAEKIAQIMPLSYQDPYLKKIQLALYEIAQVYKNNDIPVECDITVAADYQIPKVLETMKILEYSQELSKKIDNYELIEKNSKEENALRAATIIACEKISQIHNISIPALDRVLWLARNEFKDKKFHLTKTTNY